MFAAVKTLCDDIERTRRGQYLPDYAFDDFDPEQYDRSRKRWFPYKTGCAGGVVREGRDDKTPAIPRARVYHAAREVIKLIQKDHKKHKGTFPLLLRKFLATMEVEIARDHR